MCFAEQGEREYGGNSEYVEKFSRKFLTDVYYEGQNDCQKYGPWWEIPADEDLEDLYVTWMSNFWNWDPQKNAQFAKQKCGMEMLVGGNIGTFTNYAQNEDMLVVDCSEGVSLREMVTAAEHEHEHENEHEPGTLDPHIWMSPQNAQIMVRNIADGLIQVDPGNRAYYQQNRDAYLEELAQLDQEIREDLSGLQNRVFMVYHPAFGYFATKYDLTMLPIEDEGKEPTPAGLQHLIEQAIDHDIHIVFTEPQFNPQSAEVIADAIDGRVVLTDPLARDYIENLRTLAEELVKAME